MKQSVLVIGLGRFGTAAARELMAIGHEVLAIDRDEARVNEIAPRRHVGAAGRRERRGRAQGPRCGRLRPRDRGDQRRRRVEHLRDDGAAQPRRGVRLAKAGTALHGSILERVGATRVVYPEREMGEQVAHAFASPHVIDYLDVAPSFGIVRVTAPPAWIGRTLGELDLVGRGLTAVALRRGDRITVSPGLDSGIESGDELVLIAADDRLVQLEGSSRRRQPRNRSTEGTTADAARTTRYAAISSSPA